MGGIASVRRCDSGNPLVLCGGSQSRRDEGPLTGQAGAMFDAGQLPSYRRFGFPSLHRGLVQYQKTWGFLRTPLCSRLMGSPHSGHLSAGTPSPSTGWVIQSTPRRRPPPTVAEFFWPRGRGIELSLEAALGLALVAGRH